MPEREPTPGTGSIGGGVTGAIGPQIAARAAGRAAGAAASRVTAGVQEVAPVDSLDALRDGAAAVRRWISDRHNWTRVAWFASGCVCFAIGAAMLAGRPAASAVTTVIPAGKAVKALGAVK